MSVRKMFELTDQKAIVTGAGGGIGTELCLGLAEMGADVALVDTHRENMEKVAEKVRGYDRKVIICETDVSRASDVDDMVSKVLKEWGGIDILVNCAGIVRSVPAETIKEEDWDRIMDVNLKGTFLCCKAVAPHMIAKKSGKIINIASISARISNRPQIAYHAHYNASKAGVVMLTKTLAAEWATHNINVNSISPGYILTPITMARGPEYHEIWKKMIPMGRLGDPSELKGAVVYLASRASSLMTGHDLVIDAGYTVW